MISITPLKILKRAIHICDVPGVCLLPALLKHMGATDAAGNAPEEGMQIALELTRKIKAYQGIHGLHIMPVTLEEIVPRLVSEGGLQSEGFVPPTDPENLTKSQHRIFCRLGVEALLPT
jgi:5,10-methylenetetrahydrofolate reductase